MKKVKVGIVGCGNISQIYFENLTKVFQNIEVYACCDLIEERAKAKAEEFSVPNIMTLKELLSDPQIDILLNLTTPQGHYDICKASLLAGKHTYVEKPLSLTFEEGQELMQIAKKKQLFLGGAPDTFLGGGLQSCRKYIDDGLIGEPLGASAFMVCHGHESWHPDPAFYYKTGGGPLFDMGPYYLTALVSLMGSVKTVSGMTNTAFPTRTITSQPHYGEEITVEVPTHIAGTMQFENGAGASMIMSFDVWGSTLPRIEIYGTRGTLIVPDPNTFGGPIMVRMNNASEFSPLPLTHIYAENSRGIGVADMAQCILDGGIPRAGCDLNGHVLEVMEAFYNSAQQQRHYRMHTTCHRPEPLPLDLIPGFVK